MGKTILFAVTLFPITRNARFLSHVLLNLGCGFVKVTLKDFVAKKTWPYYILLTGQLLGMVLKMKLGSFIYNG